MHPNTLERDAHINRLCTAFPLILLFFFLFPLPSILSRVLHLFLFFFPFCCFGSLLLFFLLLIFFNKKKNLNLDLDWVRFGFVFEFVICFGYGLWIGLWRLFVGFVTDVWFWNWNCNSSWLRFSYWCGWIENWFFDDSLVIEGSDLSLTLFDDRNFLLKG